MTKQEKNLCKKVVKNLTIYTYGISVLGVITMLIGITLILNATAGNTTGNEILVFGVGALILVIAMLLAARTHTKYEIPLQAYRNDLLFKKDKNYYNKVCSHTKNNNIDKAMFYHNLIKNNILKDISLGFVFGKVYEKMTAEEYNAFVQKYIDDLN